MGDLGIFLTNLSCFWWLVVVLILLVIIMELSLWLGHQGILLQERLLPAVQESGPSIHLLWWWLRNVWRLILLYWLFIFIFVWVLRFLRLRITLLLYLVCALFRGNLLLRAYWGFSAGLSLSNWRPLFSLHLSTGCYDAKTHWLVWFWLGLHASYVDRAIAVLLAFRSSNFHHGNHREHTYFRIYINNYNFKTSQYF